MKDEVCILSATGMLGSGFKEETFFHALSMKPDVIGCDAGSSDPGPYYLGAGIPRTSKRAAKRDLRLMIKGGVENHIPVLLGSAGTSGGDPHVDWTMELVREIAQEEHLHFKVAEIKTEINNEQLADYIRRGRFHPLEGAPEFRSEDVNRLSRCVGVIGAEPFIKALDESAQVVIAGRSSDTSIYAALPIREGLGGGGAWHAAKILECGAACAEHRPYPDCMMAWVRRDSISIEPPNPVMACTPVSCVAHSLYENSNPFVMAEPGGSLDVTNAVYQAENSRRVRITGSVFRPASQHTIKLEAVELIGYRTAVIGGIHDPQILKQLDHFLHSCFEKNLAKTESSLGLKPDQYKLRYIVYGQPEAGPVGVLWEVIGKTKDDAIAIINCVWHNILHVSIKEWSGHQSQYAFPFSPPAMEAGEAYRFALNHVLDVDDPLELCRIRYELL